MTSPVPEAPRLMPALFLGHGSPMNAIEDNEFSRAWMEMGRQLPTPKAILCISAHWETDGTRVTAMTKPSTIHDFGGFPRQLYEMQYPAAGSPDLARLVEAGVRLAVVSLDTDWGLDHGAWSVLCRLFPAADVPVVQLSLDQTQDAEFHYRLGKELRFLREQGVFILGSGNIVHNLRLAVPGQATYDWAADFDDAVQKRVDAGDHAALIHYDQLGRAARLSIPTPEHYLPFLYILSQQGSGEKMQTFCEGMVYGSLSMRSFLVTSE